MINIALELEQQQRLENGIAAYEAQIDRETDLYHAGLFDGKIAHQPTHLEKQSYWSGYEIGLRKYWAKKLEIALPTEF